MGRNRGGVKVPGVKLRPADTKPGQLKNNILVSDDDDDNVPPTPPRANMGLFRGVVLCATGIKNKRELFDIVKRMGGTHSTDFTDLTTHLIADIPGSEKYRCAIERCIPVVSPAWVYEAYKRWLDGEIFSLESTVDAFRLPFLKGIRLCVTGIDTAEQRERVQKMTKSFGGEYLRNLDKTCTHLLCAVDTSDKVTWSNKINRERELEKVRGSQGIPNLISLVWEEWLWDCVFMKGLLDCEPYHISRPRPKPLSSAEVAEFHLAYTVSLPSSSTVLPPQLPLSTLLNDTSDTTAQVKRKKNVAAKEWEAIMKGKGLGIVNGEMQNTGSGSHPMEGGSLRLTGSPMKKTWMTGSPNTHVKGWGKRSPMKRPIAVGKKDLPASPARPIPIQLSKRGEELEQPVSSLLGKISKNGAFDDANHGSEGQADEASLGVVQLDPKRIFEGIRMRLLGEADCMAVGNAVAGAGGLLSDEGPVNYYVVRLVGGAGLMLSLSPEEHPKFRTECWLERCLFEGRVCNVEENITYSPLVIVRPLDNDLNVAISGLDSSERTWVSRLLRLLGITLSTTFSAQCTHLLCPSRHGIKCKKAAEWNIPIVGFDWLTDLAKQATTQDGLQTQAPGASKGTALPMDKSLEALKIDKPRISLPFNRQPEEASLEEKLAMSPVFRVPSPIRFDDLSRPPSPKSPSPQGNRTVSAKRRSMETMNIAEPRPISSAVASKATPLRTPTKFQNTQRIPSSASPSPLKVQSPLNVANDSVSVAASVLTFPSAKALSKNIGAVLGSKRSAEDSDTGVASVSASEGPRKRPRRPQANMTKSFSSGTPKKLSLATDPHDYDHGQESYIENEAMSLTESTVKPQGGIAVSYSDPKELEEQKRLHMLLNGVTIVEEPVKMVTGRELPASQPKPAKPRRSGRLRG